MGVADQESIIAEICEDKAAGKYEAFSASGEMVGWLGYRRNKDVVEIYTTQTLPRYRGKGVASALATRVLDDCLEANVTVDAACWYAAEFVQRHPKYQRLIVDLGF